MTLTDAKLAHIEKNLEYLHLGMVQGLAEGKSKEDVARWIYVWFLDNMADVERHYENTDNDSSNSVVGSV